MFSDGSLAGFLIYDSDENGSLDDFIEVPIGGYEATGLNDPSKWLEYN